MSNFTFTQLGALCWLEILAQLNKSNNHIKKYITYDNLIISILPYL